MLNRYHDQLVATEAKFPIAENQVITAVYLLLNRSVYAHVLRNLNRHISVDHTCHDVL